MKKLLFPLLFGTVAVYAQTDTLRNFDNNSSMYAPKYEGNGQHGYVLGQNHLYRQQFAEKYNISGATRVHGIIAHLTGVYANRSNFVEFNVYSVNAVNKLPDKKLASAQILYPDLDLSGSAYYVSLPVPVAVSDSFFVTFNVQDYMHGGYDGDTLGLFCAVAGTRSKEDLARFGRNAIQAHNHIKEDWRDFYTQNFSPIATHFALFPVVDKMIATNIHDNKISSETITLYPNPTSEGFYVKSSEVDHSVVEVYNLQAQLLLVKDVTAKDFISLQGFPESVFAVVIKSNEKRVIGKLIKY